MRSYRKTMQFLWAFGIAGLGIGAMLVIVFGLKRSWKLVLLGLSYILIASILLAIRNVLNYLDQERKRKRHIHTSPRHN